MACTKRRRSRGWCAIFGEARKLFARARRRRRDRSHGRNSAGKFQGTGRDRRLRDQSSETIRWAWINTDELWSGRGFVGKLGRQRRRARFGASIDWRSAAAVALWNGGAKEEIFAARGGRRDFRVRVDRNACRFR